MSVISIQSHVSYGYVGNKAATFPLQSLGFDVWPIHTVQFSNHTGYDTWKGDVFSAQHIQDIIQGLVSLNVIKDCDAILSGYIGDKAIGSTIFKMVERCKVIHPNLIYLCDPVMGPSSSKKCFVKSDINDLFRKKCLSVADIITPNHFEAEILAGTTITTVEDLQKVCTSFHRQGVSIVIITSLKIQGVSNTKGRLALLSVKDRDQWIATTPDLKSMYTINGTGDLFAAVYLAQFLLTRAPLVAFRYALATTYQVTKATIKSKQRELKIIGHHYGNIDLSSITVTPLSNA